MYDYDSGISTYRVAQAKQMTWSRGNPWPKGKGKGPVGGPFDTIKTDFRFNRPIDTVDRIVQAGGAPLVTWEGNIIPCNPDIPNAFREGSTWIDLAEFVPSLGDSVLGAKGAMAISQSAPTAPAADTVTGLAELLREGMPSIVGAATLKNRTHLAKSAGSEYLNVQFGWLPLVSDIRSAAQAVVDSDKIIKQLIRDSGKTVRRHYAFPVDRSIQHETLAGNMYPPPYLDINKWVNWRAAPTHTTLIQRKVWFDGAFTYHVDPDVYHSDFQGMVAKARYLLGVRLTPDVVWNLTPWSWLIDWVFNIGPVLTNVGLFAQDGLTLRYGYTMEETKVTHVYRFGDLWPNGGSGAIGTWEPPMTGTWTGTRKRRLEQSPFSLGLVGTDLNLRQLAILSALGISRA